MSWIIVSLLLSVATQNQKPAKPEPPEEKNRMVAIQVEDEARKKLAEIHRFL